MNLNFNNLQFSSPKQNSFGGQYVYINQPDRSKVCISTPICSLPFGLNTYKGSNTLDLQVRDQELNNFLSEFDHFVVEAAEKNSFSWFKRYMHRSVISELFNKQIKQNGNYLPLFKIKLNKDTVFVDKDNETTDISCITKGSKICAEIENTGLYFTKGSFGVSWKVTKCKVFPNEQLSGYSFVNDD